MLGLLGPLGINELVALPREVISGGATLETPEEYLAHLLAVEGKERPSDI